jgi:hypothetical protein
MNEKDIEEDIWKIIMEISPVLTEKDISSLKDFLRSLEKYLDGLQILAHRMEMKTTMQDFEERVAPSKVKRDLRAKKDNSYVDLAEISFQSTPLPPKEEHSTEFPEDKLQDLLNMTYSERADNISEEEIEDDASFFEDAGIVLSPLIKEKCPKPMYPVIMKSTPIRKPVYLCGVIHDFTVSAYKDCKSCSKDLTKADVCKNCESFGKKGGIYAKFSLYLLDETPIMFTVFNKEFAQLVGLPFQEVMYQLRKNKEWLIQTVLDETIAQFLCCRVNLKSKEIDDVIGGDPFFIDMHTIWKYVEVEMQN